MCVVFDHVGYRNHVGVTYFRRAAHRRFLSFTLDFHLLFPIVARVLTMGKLNIAHHKSYHPYRADNIARVRQDEARAKAEAELDNDRALAADAEARIDALRKRAGIEFAAGPSTASTGEIAPTSASIPASIPAAGPSSTPDVSSTPKAPTEPSGHINLFADLESHELSLAARASQKKPALTNEDRGVALAPSKEDLTPWYSSSKDAAEEGKSGGKGKRAGWAARELRRKESSDPLTAIPAHIRQPARSGNAYISRSSSSRTPSGDDASSARLTRESSERARAQALIARKKAERARSDGSTIATPSTVHGGYGDMYNRVEVEEARRERTWGRRGREVDMKGRRWDDDSRRR